MGLNEVLLVPLPTRRREALLLGSEQAMDVLHKSGLADRSIAGGRGPSPQVLRSILSLGGAQATRQAGALIDCGRIVSISKETMEQLKTGEPMRDAAGNMLGLVLNNSGRIRHVMRLGEAGPQALVASNAARLAMMVALGEQLQHIEQQLVAIRETLERLAADVDRHRLWGAFIRSRSRPGIPSSPNSMQERPSVGARAE